MTDRSEPTPYGPAGGVHCPTCGDLMSDGPVAGPWPADADDALCGDCRAAAPGADQS